MNNRQLGTLGEDTAVAYLTLQGYDILERNYRCPFGEIDVIARQKEVLVFVEVKTRQSDRYGHPAEAVNQTKLLHMQRAALWYLEEKQWPPCLMRFDTIALQVEQLQGVM